MRKITLITWLISLITCQGVTFADTPFEGFRASAQLGYGLIDAKVKFVRALLPNASDNSDVSGRGGLGGFAFDWCGVVGNSDILMGAEVGMNFYTSKGRKSTMGTFLLAPASNDLTTTVFFKRSLELTFKLGYLAKGAALGYIKFGPSLGHWKASTVSNSFPASGAASAHGLGFVIGIGAELPLSDRFSAGVEYGYRSYKDFNHILCCSANTALRTVGVKPSSNAIMLRLNYKLSAVDFASTPPQKERKRKRAKRPRNSDS